MAKENNEFKNRIANYIKTIDEYKQKNDNFEYKFGEYGKKMDYLELNNNELLSELKKKNRDIEKLKNKINNLNNDISLSKNINDKISEGVFDNDIKNSISINDKLSNIFIEQNLDFNKRNKNNNKYKKQGDTSLEYNKDDYIWQTENKRNIKNNKMISPKNYDLIISYSINNYLKWYLFKKKSKESDSNNSIVKNIYKNEYNNYFWVSCDEIENIEEFKKNSEYKSINYKKLIKSKSDNGLIGLSFIKKDEKDISNFLDDYGFEDILNDFGDNAFNKNSSKYNIYNIQNNNNKIYFNTHNKYYPNNINNYSKSSNGNIYKKDNIKNNKNNNLRQTIDILLSQINPTTNFMNTFSSILKQLGCFDDDIFNLIENYNNKDNKSSINEEKKIYKY